METHSDTKANIPFLLFSSHAPPFLMHSLAFLPQRRMTNVIRTVVTIRQMLKRWRLRPRGSTTPRTPSQVPAGYVAVYVGSNHRRYVLRATYLNHPTFKRVLAEAEEEFGFPAEGPLVIPCEESLFKEILTLVSRSNTDNDDNDQRSSSYVGMRGWVTESRPLLNGVAD